VDEALEVEVNEMMPPPRSPSDIGIPMLNNKNETRKSKKKNANAAGLLLKGLGSMFRFGKHRKSAPASPESGHQSSGSVPTVSGHHSMAGGHMIMPSSGNQSHHHHQNERRSSSGHSGSIGRSSAVTEVDRHHVLRRTLPPDERDRAELGRQMAIAVARQVNFKKLKFVRMIKDKEEGVDVISPYVTSKRRGGKTTSDSPETFHRRSIVSSNNDVRLKASLDFLRI
jgi:hypothetical protein